MCHPHPFDARYTSGGPSASLDSLLLLPTPYATIARSAENIVLIGQEMEAAIIANLKEKSGKDPQGWIDWLGDQGVSGKKESEAALKAEGLGTFQARVVATRAAGQDHYKSEKDLVSQLFEGFAAERRFMDRVNAEHTVANLRAVIERVAHA